ncbi:hypothetical protein PPYR_09702 [Photinus pyralis]|uniref:Protein-lysine N-methyltransferase SMYD4 n=1 Tax=Photinus pyralis TaxID=7054 RepID=A0A5N4AN01_PHOPY|nr:SET and MYND domain-containing protein 4-like [Photinus pyralis]KAB0798709.1 hypothetical protein PPYR_09702 [Photinus pyralis]
MKQISNFFNQNYAELLNKLTGQLYEKFENTADEDERVKLLYPHLQCILIKPEIYGKSMEDALKEKSDGNAYFVKNDCGSALNCYSTGVLKCPQNSLESRKLLAILVANRSACLYDLRQYEATLSDINYVTHLNVYPEHLKYKLFFREAKCYTLISSKIHLAGPSYKLALDYLDLSTLDKSAIEKKKLEVRNALKSLDNLKRKETKEKIVHFKCNPLFPSASASVMFDFEPDLGRFARAACDIEAGEIIVQEPAHCAVLATKFSLTNCQYCTKSTNAPLPCEKCANVCFCSFDCKSAASVYHRYECGLHHTIAESQASINCLMALRMITQSSISQLETVIKHIAISPQIHTFNNYACVYSLCRNEQLRNTKQYFHYTIMAVYLLRVLKTTSYFGSTSQDNKLTDDEVFICKLILHNLEMLQFNAHEVSELHQAPPGPLDSQDEPNFKAIYVGGGLYPTLAFFNHSCDPCIVRYNIGSKMIAKTVKPIRKGEVIYENYGPIYTNSPKAERQQFLLENYWFTCHCKACEQDWPLFKEMEDNVIKIPCKNTKCANFFFLNDNVDNPSIRCTSCNSLINLFPHLKALADLENILFEAEGRYKENNYTEAMDLYLKAMKIYFKNTVPPFPDWVKVQQRLRTCFVSFGNRCANYDKIKKIDE